MVSSVSFIDGDEAIVDQLMDPRDSSFVRKGIIAKECNYSSDDEATYVDLPESEPMPELEHWALKMYFHRAVYLTPNFLEHFNLNHATCHEALT